MTDYDIFAKFYNTVMGDRLKSAEKIKAFVEQSNPTARNILELACGTGTIMKYLAKDYKISGLDLSQEMLAIAMKEMPNSIFCHQSMVNFEVPEKFDVILCCFDSLNHIIDFNDWQSIFNSSYNHLNDGGVFIFDINTQAKLESHSKAPTWVYSFEENIMLMKVQEFGENIFNWNIKVFEHQESKQYLLHEENIKETTFPTSKISQALKQFKSIKVIDPKRIKPSKKTERLYFICGK